MGLTLGGTQYVRNSAAPALSEPVTVGLWVYPTTTAVTATFWSMSDTATDNNFFKINQETNLWAAGTAGGTANKAATAGTVTVNQWAFIIGRFQTAQRRVAVLQYDGSTAHGINANAASSAGVDSVQVGCLYTNAGISQLFTGAIAEVWYTDSDIQADSGQLNDSLLRQLAYSGPFSVPHVGQKVVEYRSLRSGVDSTDDKAEDVYSGRFGRQIWTNFGATTGVHPALPPLYRRPDDASQFVLI